MDFNERMVDRLHEQWLNPPDDEEPELECCMCNRPAEYEVMGELYCEHCMESEFRIRR